MTFFSQNVFLPRLQVISLRRGESIEGLLKPIKAVKAIYQVYEASARP